MINFVFWKNNLFLTSFFIFYYFNSIHSFSCPEKTPFIVGDKSCADFTEICIKSDNRECQNLLTACKQCPPTNFTASMLSDIMAFVKVQSNVTKEIMNEKIDRLTVRFNSTEAILQSKMSKLIGRMTAELVFWAILFIIFLLLLIIRGVAFCRKRHIFTIRRPSRHMQEQMVTLVDPGQTNDNRLVSEINSLATNCNKRFENIDTRMQQFFELCDRLRLTVTDVSLQLNHVLERNAATAVTIEKLKFYMIGLDKPLEIGIQSNDNIIKIKHQLCSKLVNAKPHDCKRMKIMINENTVDDNHYLLPLIKSPTDKIRCEVDWSINDSDIVILQLQGNRCLPEMIQIQRHQKISNLKKIILNFNQSPKFAIYKDSEELDDNLTIGDCALADYDWIKVIAIESGKLAISSIFDDGQSWVLDYTNIDKLSWIKVRMAEKLGCHIDDLILAYGSNYCEDNTFLFQMNLTSDSGIRFLNSMTLDRVDIGAFLKEGDSSELYDASEKWTKKEIVMKRYELASIKKLKDNELLLNDLIKLQITKTHARFVRTSGMYHNEKYFYIAMEKIKGSLDDVLKDNSAVSKENIRIWAHQILEGLSFLHEHNIVHGDIKPSNILLTDQNEVKLSVLGLSKYRHGQNHCHLKKGLTLAKIGTMMYMAPEVSKGEPFEFKADIFAFGVTLIEMFYGKHLSVSGPKKNEKFQEVLQKLNIEEEMKRIIRECLTLDCQSRPSAKALLDEDAFKM